MLDAFQLRVDPFEQRHHVVVDQVVEQVLFGRYVVVEGARLQADAGCELAKAHGVEALGINEVETCLPYGGLRLLAR